MDNSLKVIGLLLTIFVLLQVNAFEIEITPSTDTYAVKYNLVYFMCKVKYAGSSSVTISWLVNGRPVNSPPPYKLKWKYGGIMMIRPLFVGRSNGLYECVAKDTKGTTVRKGFRLTVKEEKDLPQGFPKIVESPKSAYLMEGETAILTCKATGNPMPKMKWFVSHSPLEFTDPRVKLLPDNSLKIVNVTLRSMGLFECEASNSLGRRMSRRVGIFVKEREEEKISPTLTKTQEDLTIDSESNVKLTCAATGKPQPIFSWYKNGKLQTGGTDGNLYLERVVKSANYTCQARNGAKRTVNSTSQVIVRPKPLTPSRPKFVNNTVSSITVTWGPNYMEIYPITGYIVRYRIKGSSVWNEKLVKLPKMTFTYNGLKPYTFCEFQIIAVNNIGQSRPGRIMYFASAEAVPATPARNLLGKGVSETSFNATWDAPLILNGRIRRYRVYFTADKNDPLSDWSLVYAGLTWKVIRRVEKQQVYYFRIQVVGYAGVGPISTEVGVVKAQAGVPGLVSKVVAVATGSRNISVSWDDPIYQGNGLDGYEVGYQTEKVVIKQPVEFGHRKFVLTGLSPYTSYKIFVSAKSFSGTGPPSEPIQTMTLEDKPTAPPQGSRARPRSSTSIEVFWQPPLKSHQNGKITGYNVMYTHIRTAAPKILSVDGLQRSAMLTGLRKFTKYTIWVTATNSKGEGPPSNKFELFTDEDVPEGAPKNIRVQALNDSAISVSWKEPTEKSGRIRGYFVYYLHVKDNFELYPDKTLPSFYDADSSRDRHAVVTSNVEPSTTYRITVAAYTLKGDGARSLPVYVKTPKRLPPAPMIRRAVLLNPPKSTDVRLSWKPKIPGVLRYKIVYGKALSKFDSLADERSVFVRVSNRTTVFSGLDYGVWYCFKVSQETAVDWSSESRIWVEMPEGKPKGPPLDIKAITGSATSIKLTWASPDPWLRHGKITKYVVNYRKVPNGEKRSKELLITSPDTRLEMIVNGLQVNSRYSFRITAFTKAGKGPHSISVTSQTDNEELPVVKSIAVEDITSKSVLIKWEPPATTTGFKIIGYQVSVSGSKSYKDNAKTKEVRSFEEKLITPPQLSAFFDGLKPFLFYTATVRIDTSSGTGDHKSAHFKTPSIAPPAAEPPRGIQVVKNSIISVILSPSSEINGPISFYHLCVIDYGLSSQVTIPGNAGGKRQKRSSEGGETYVTAELKSDELPRIVLVGDGSKIGGYVNKKLIGGHSYRLFVRAYVRQGSKYLNTTSSLTQPVTLPFLATPPVPKKNEQKAATTDGKSSGSNGVLIAAAVIGTLFVLLIVASIICIVRRRKRSRDPDEETSKTLLRDMNGSLSHGNKPKDLVGLHRSAHPTNGMMSHPPIPVENFAAHLSSLKANDFEKLFQEFESINPGQKFVSVESNQLYNKYKNRYPSLLAYDHTRVLLSQTDEPGSDYLNGNFIDGNCTKKEYIATQGPLPNTVADFWRACWEHNCTTIVMMTKLEERGRTKCEQYWPSSGMATYGKVHVSKLEQLELATYTKRTFEISEADSSERRIVKQFQFTAWPDREVPKNPGPFLTFVKRVRKENGNAGGPMIIHCSAGVGKTACFIAIDAMLERINNDNTVDIYGYVTMMRSQRNFMIQSDEQYIFVHDAIMDAIASGSTEVTADSLFNHFKNLTDFNRKGVEYLEEDFKVVVNCTVPDANNSTVAHLPINRQKNRCQSIVPYDSNRVSLQQIRGCDGSDYVNASHIDGYKERKAYIAAQGPLEENTEEFWRMVMEQNCSLIVMLTNLDEKGKEMCHKYWPTEKSERYYYYVIEPVNETRYPHFCVREFKVTDARDGEARKIRQFQYLNWPKNGVPLASEGIIEMIGQVNKSKQQLNNSGPVLCHSNTGAGRTGVFIALCIILERLQIESVIDIHRTIKTLRLERPYLVQTVDQYRFCFQVAVDYLRNFDMVV